MIWAQSSNGIIGAGGKLPWHIPGDLEFFKAATLNKVIIMGRKTHQSIGRALPGRFNIVVTGDVAYDAPGCLVVHTVDDALAVARRQATSEAVFIGGEKIYEAGLKHAQNLYVTHIHREYQGDTSIPDLDWDDWCETWCIEAPVGPNSIPHSYHSYTRKVR
jgi:dihydrofolate reductase